MSSYESQHIEKTTLQEYISLLDAVQVNDTFEMVTFFIAKSDKNSTVPWAMMGLRGKGRIVGELCAQPVALVWRKYRCQIFTAMLCALAGSWEWISTDCRVPGR